MKVEAASEFCTSDRVLAALARAAGGKLVRIDDRNPGRLIFFFLETPTDFDTEVFNGSITVNAQAVYAALEGIHSLLAKYRRRGQEQ